MKLSTKLYLGFAVMLSFGLVQSLWSYHAIKQNVGKNFSLATHYAPLNVDANNLEASVLQAGYANMRYFYSIAPTDFGDVKKFLASVEATQPKVFGHIEGADALKALSLPDGRKLSAVGKEIADAAATYNKISLAIGELGAKCQKEHAAYQNAIKDFSSNLRGQYAVVEKYRDQEIAAANALCEEFNARPLDAPGAQAAPAPAASPKPIAKPAEKPVAKPAAKPVEKPAEKPLAKPADQPAEKPAAKPTEKPAAKPMEKPTGKPAAKPADKANDAPIPSPFGKGLFGNGKTGDAPLAAGERIREVCQALIRRMGRYHEFDTMMTRVAEIEAVVHAYRVERHPMQYYRDNNLPTPQDQVKKKTKELEDILRSLLAGTDKEDSQKTLGLCIKAADAIGVHAVGIIDAIAGIVDNGAGRLKSYRSVLDNTDALSRFMNDHILNDANTMIGDLKQLEGLSRNLLWMTLLQILVGVGCAYFITN
ncbi:MAG: hypothetical protein J6333_05380, partial [Planctomycetes bacterium]|nr:hypothetical protein [Planctomycetota bacterium]